MDNKHSLESRFGVYVYNKFNNNINEKKQNEKKNWFQMLLTERYLKHAFTIRLGSCSVHRPNQALPKRENTKSKYLYNNWKAKCAFDFRCSRIREFEKEIKKTIDRNAKFICTFIQVIRSYSFPREFNWHWLKMME